MGVAGVLGTHTMATRLIATDGTDDQKSRWLPGMASGEIRSGLALTEPGAGSDLQGISTIARRDGDVYIVNGSKTWITNARHAAMLPVLVKTDPTATPPHRGISILLVEAGTRGFDVGKDLPKLGYKGPESAEVSISECRVPVQNLLGAHEGRGLQQALTALEFGRCNIAGRAVGVAQAALDLALTALEFGRCNIAGRAVGVAQAALDLALAYAGERRAFGRPIADFQAIQLKLAVVRL